MWGFTVDDALISVRYAHHLATGHGWRFDIGAASTDGVTPLPWPVILAPLARTSDALAVLGRAKLLGLASWTLTGALLGDCIGRERAAPAWARGAILITTGLSVPLAAHAVSGMETALATCLATSAAVGLRRPFVAALFAGLAATLRPELAPWACVLVIGSSMESGASIGRAVGAATATLMPFTLCAVARAALWGRPAPLALWAKPSDLSHGAAYVGAGLVVGVLPILVMAPSALRAPRARVIVVAAAVHAAVVLMLGGDGMPYARLLVPILPSIAYAGTLTAARGRSVATAARCLAALALGAWLLWWNWGQGRHVGEDRAALIASARPWLASSGRIAALDIGWVGAATEADIVDLAGVTDPVVASLPGGHTSKRVGPMFLLGRDPDALLLYSTGGPPGGQLSAWQDALYPRVVEARLAHDEVIARHFLPTAWLPLGTMGAGYVLLRKRAEITGADRGLCRDRRHHCEPGGRRPHGPAEFVASRARPLHPRGRGGARVGSDESCLPGRPR
jgi:hypothetical protein